MTIEEIKSQLRELIDDRQSLKSGKHCDAIDNEIYDNDIAALTEAINAVSCVAEMANIAKQNIAHWDIACGSNTPFCSSCGEEPPAYTMTAYCPHCGCKMCGCKKVTRESDDNA